jgi:hypothetical protein
VFGLALVGGIAWLRKLRSDLKIIPERYAAHLDAVLAEKDMELEQQREETAAALTAGGLAEGRRKKNRLRVVQSEGAKEELAEQEMRKLRQLFYEFDDDGSGALDREEIALLTEQLGGRLTEEELDAAMYDMDEDGSGDVDFEEFHEWYAAAKDGGSKLANLLQEDEGGSRKRRSKRGKDKKGQRGDTPPQGGRYIKGIWVPDTVGPFDVTGLWEMTGTNTDDDEVVTEHMWLEQTDLDGIIIGNDADEQGQRTDDPYAVKDAKWDGYTLSFTQEYPDGAKTLWKAKVTRHADGHLVMMGGQWAGDCNGFFTARILSGEVKQPPPQVDVESAAGGAPAAEAEADANATPASAAVGPSSTKLKFQRGVNLAAAKAMLAKEMKPSAGGRKAAGSETAVSGQGQAAVAAASAAGAAVGASSTKLKFQRGVNLAAAKAMLAKEMKPSAGGRTAQPAAAAAAAAAAGAAVGLGVEGRRRQAVEVEGRRRPADKAKAAAAEARVGLGVEGRRRPKDAASAASGDGFRVEGKRAAAAVPAAGMRRKGSVVAASMGAPMSGPLARVAAASAEQPKPRTRRSASIVASSSAAPRMDGPLARAMGAGQPHVNETEQPGAGKPRTRRSASIVAGSSGAPMKDGPLARRMMAIGE